MSEKYKQFYRRSLDDPEAFWAEQSELVYWNKKFNSVLEYKNPPFCRWFVGGETNLCFNAVDRHLNERSNQKGIIYISSETGERKEFSYGDIYNNVNAVSVTLKKLGVNKGDRVIIYMPMVPEAVFSILACVRIGAIHCIVFGGFAPASLAIRIDDAKPKVIITADAGMRGGRVIRYKPLVDEALKITTHPPEKVLILNRGLDHEISFNSGSDLDYQSLIDENAGKVCDPQWLESSEPSYIVYTSGTTGIPKGVQRDTGGHAVALAASMRYIYCGEAGETMFTTSDIGWIVGHSYIIYGPLLAGMTTIIYEGLPTQPDPSVWWKIVEQYKVDVMFSSPTALRVLKKQDSRFIKSQNLSSLKHLFLAGEPLDEPTHKWAVESLGVPVLDHFWQTETGWPILTPVPGIERTPVKLGSPSFPAYGYNLKILSEETENEVASNEKGVVAIIPPLPPGCMSTVWGDDQRFVDTYFKDFKSKLVYSTFDWGIRDEDGYYFILGRTDDVINVAGHRLGTREIEEAVQSQSDVAEVAVVGIRDKLKGQTPIAFTVLKKSELRFDAAKAEKQVSLIKREVEKKLGAIARPSKIFFVSMLPKTRSGKLLRRSIQALAEGRPPGDLTTLEDPRALDEIKSVLK